MNQTGIIDIFAGVALLIGDILALLSLFGSIMVLLIAIISFLRRKYIRSDDRFLMASITGLFFGAVLQICVFLSKQKTPFEGIFIRMVPQTVNLILALSFCLLFLSFLVLRATKMRPGYIAPPTRKRLSSRKNLASGNEFNYADERNDLENPRQRKKAVTITREDIETEVAWVFSTLYPVK